MGQKFDVMVNFTNAVKRSAVGRWDLVCQTLLPDTSEAIEQAGRKHVTCPFHGGKNDFRVSKHFATDGRLFCTCFPNQSTDVIKLLMVQRAWDFPTTMQNIAQVLGETYRETSYTPVKPVRSTTKAVDDDTPTDKEIIDRNSKYWAQSLALDHPDAEIARKYLASRGLPNIGALTNVRFIQELPYYNDDTKSFERYPALLSVISQPNGHPSTLHRTFLAHNGQSKAAVANPRKEFPTPSCYPKRGGAIRITDTKSPVLLIAEGLETALSAQAISGYPAWSTVNAGMLESIEIPDYVKVVTIFADRDRSLTGQNASIELCKKLREQGKKAMIFLPPFSIPTDQKGLDWNDVIKELGSENASNHFQVQRWKRSVEEILSKPEDYPVQNGQEQLNR